MRRKARFAAKGTKTLAEDRLVGPFAEKWVMPSFEGASEDAH